MKHRVEIHAFEAALVLCAAALVALVYIEGWIWPLKAAAVVLPITLLVKLEASCPLSAHWGEREGPVARQWEVRWAR